MKQPTREESKLYKKNKSMKAMEEQYPALQDLHKTETRHRNNSTIKVMSCTALRVMTKTHRLDSASLTVQDILCKADQYRNLVLLDTSFAFISRKLPMINEPSVNDDGKLNKWLSSEHHYFLRSSLL